MCSNAPREVPVRVIVSVWRYILLLYQPAASIYQGMKMYKDSHQWLLSALFAMCQLVVGASVSAHDAAKHVIEAEQKVRTVAAFDHSDYLSGNEIRVAVYEGKVTLSGRVKSLVNHDLAKQIALGVAGITRVDNRIVIDATYQPVRAISERSYSEMAAQLTLANDKVSAFEKSMVTDVDNHTGWGADTWVTAKVKFFFLYSGAIDSGAISVNTNNGIVTLNGSISGGAERALAIALAGNVSGVRAVDARAFTRAVTGDKSLAAR